MWFNDELVERETWGSGRGRGNRRRPVLEVNARLRDGRTRLLTRMVGVVLFLVATVAVAALGRLGFLEAERAVYSSNVEYRVTNVVFECHGSDELRRYVESKLHSLEGTNLFAIDLQKMHGELSAIPHVKTVFIRRRLPETLEVLVKERMAVARLGNPGDERRCFLVDDEGVIFMASSDASRMQARLRPVIRGYTGDSHSPGERLARELGDALLLLDVWMTRDVGKGIQIEEVAEMGREIHVRLKGGPVVALPRSDSMADEDSYRTAIEGRLAYLQIAIRKADAADRPLQTLSLVQDDYTHTCYGTPRWDRKD